MSSGEVRRVLHQKIQLVQNLIERCLQLYMNQEEVVGTLLVQAEIDPGFTELVWQKLEQDNQDFFKAYHLRLMLKHQIECFNTLLEKQVELMLKTHPAGAASLPISDGSSTFPLQQTPSCYVMEHAVTPAGSDNMHHTMHSSTAVINAGSSVHQSMDMSDDMSHSGTMHHYPTFLSAQNTRMDILQGVNETAMKSEPRPSSCPVFTIDGDGNILDSHPTVEASVTSFSSAESSSQPLIESPLDADLAFLGRIPRMFSLSDFTASFPQSFGEHPPPLQSYSEFSIPSILQTDPGDFPDSPGNGFREETRQLDTKSKGPSQ
ncbi:hypothetical protein CKAN_00299100 [Cinnamomum micranthum f. kanehirae]|uniref:Uncharacterized protein n=1 Tax=Cinnamomum micranthum f. kanehirae TaxID=337451 RepID=A0A443N7Z4_9MAGN|nr:hypothetical protein CKAN_00299100 [Cinnamomum micranthum f. kanehirae]